MIKQSLLQTAIRLESALTPGRPEPRWAPVFIVGPPRTGTTLLYQAMCHHLRVAPPRNLIVQQEVWMAPRVSRLICALAERRAPPADHFTSSYGSTQGDTSPCEAGQVWNRWFPGGPCDQPLPEAEAQQVRAFVAGIEAGGGGPFVNKNVMHSVRIPVLARLFPNALFVEVHRNVLMAARSIYQARLRHPVNQWWSVRPPGYESLLELPLAAQAVAQVQLIHRQIEADCQSIPDRRILVRYEELCANPTGVVSGIREFMDSRQAPAAIRQPLPDSFEPPRKTTVPAAVLAELEKHVREFETGSVPFRG